MLKRFTFVICLLLSFAKCLAQIPNFIPTDSLNAFYPFTQNATNLNDVSPAAYHGSAALPIVFSTDRNGLSQQAVQGSGFIDLPSQVMNFSYNQSFTVSFWCTKPNQGSLSATLLSTADSSNNFEIDYDAPSGTLHFEFGGNALEVSLADTLWHHFAYTYNHAATIAQLYLDGEIVTGTPIFTGQNLQYGPLVRIGAKANASNPQATYLGCYDDLGIWRRLLNSCEIRSLYHDQLQFSYLYAGPDIDVCNGQETILGAQNATQAFWNNGAINGLPFTPSTGYYVLTGLDYNDCPGTDSLLITVIPEILSSISITSCDPVSYYGLNLVNSGSFQTTITAVSGCDSIVNIDFQRLIPPSVSTPTIAGSFLVTDQNSNYAYQWFACTTNTPIPGANSYLFEAPDSAFYYVMATNACGSDTTACYSLYPDASTIENQQAAISVYPNPVSTTLFVSGLSKDQSDAFQIVNELGQLCLAGHLVQDSIGIASLPDGLYLLHIDKQVFRFIKAN